MIQIRKQQKDHTELIEDYKNKNQQRLLQMSTQSPLTQAMVPLQAQQNGPTPVRAPNVPVGWTMGSGTPGPVGQRIPSHLPPRIPTTLPNNSQGLQHIKNPPSMVPGFTAGPRGPTGGPSEGPSGATGDGATLTPQVTAALQVVFFPSPPTLNVDLCVGLQVKFDDNNPFSEGFQERERRERLREQQERQRVQLMQEVGAHQRGTAVVFQLEAVCEHHFLLSSSSLF